MAIYDQPVRLLMREMVEHMPVKHGETVSKENVVRWFAEHYPKIKQGTVGAQLIKVSTNARTRIHYAAKPEDDLFFQIDGSHFRLYEPASDPPPIYGDPDERHVSDDPEQDDSEETPSAAPSEFAYETDLRSFLSKNLGILEPGLRLYEEQGVNGVEFPAGGRFIDILAVDAKNNYVVIELKVSRGYDRVVGQVRRYMGWIAKHHASQGQKVRGVIVARAITEDLRLACWGLENVQLFEYELAVTLRRVED